MGRRWIMAFMLFLVMIFTSGMSLKPDSTDKNLKIGLKNMTSTKIKITLNGTYTVDGLMYDSGLIDTLTLSKGKICFQGEALDSLAFEPENEENTIKLEVGAKKYLYRGNMTFYPTTNGILPINIIDIETYLKGVVAFEMSNSYPLEALKAQSVAARSYALTSTGKHKTLGYDLCDTTDCQVYRGYNATFGNVIKAVDSTKGKVIVYGNELVCGYFYASSGGYTEASGNIWRKQLPYLIAKKDEMESENWPYGDQMFTVSQIETKLKSNKYLKASDKFLGIILDSIQRDESGRVSSLNISYSSSDGTINEKTITKEATRTFLALPSSLYEVTYDEVATTYKFSGKGYGHGVGLSQVGAKNRANVGQTYDKILQFYYDGTKIVTMNSNIKNSGIDINSTTAPAVNVGTSSSSGIDILPPPSTSGPSIDKSPSTSSGGITNPKTTPGGVSVIPKPNEDPKPPAVIITKDKPKPPVIGIDRDLKKGMSGADVKQLQDNLKKLGFLNIKTTTTFFGDTTEKALKAFQKNNLLKTTGIADKLTKDKIISAVNK